MEKMKVSKPLRSKVMQYLNYMNENQRYGKLAEGHVFSVLSDSLKEEIVKDINGRALTENNIFAKNFDKSFLKILSNKLGETTVAPGEVIFDVLPITVIIVSNLSQETDKSCTLYLISSGIVEIYLRHCDTVISHIGVCALRIISSYFRGICTLESSHFLQEDSDQRQLEPRHLLIYSTSLKMYFFHLLRTFIQNGCTFFLFYSIS